MDARAPGMETSILSRFIECSGHAPQSEAIVIRDRSYTYADLTALCRGIFDLLRAHDVGKGDRVGILAENNIYTYASVLASLSCGACYVPVNPDNPVDANRVLIGDAGIGLLLYAEREERARELSLSPGTTCRPVSNRVAPVAGPLEPVDSMPDDLCYLLFTSGTTGKPKGVPIYHRNLAAFLEMMLNTGRYEFTSNDRFLQMFELTFDLSVFSFLVPLSVGASVHPLPQKGITYLEVADIIETREISVALMVPSVITYLKPYFDEISFPKVKYSLFCGEALYQETLSGWAGCVPSAKIENLYGPTEATIFCLRYEWQRDEVPTADGKGIVPIGKPMEGMDAFLLKENAASDEGELCLIGEQVTPAYWNNPVNTAEAFGTTESGGRFYRTGDLCKSDAAGNFLYLGRIDNQVKIDGHRVELEEIEFHARAFCGDKQVVATVNTSGTGFHFIVLFVESDQEVKAGLHEHFQKHLPAYMIPRDIVRVSLFPQNSNGKTDRKALKRRYLQEAASR